MLTNEERERLIEEETLRATVRGSLGKSDKETNAVMRLLKSENFRWVVTALAIPLSVFLWGEHDKKMEDQKKVRSDQQVRQERLAREKSETTQHNVDLVIRLLPMFSRPPGDPDRKNAFLIVKTLEDESQLPPSFRAAIQNSASDIGFEVGKDQTYKSKSVLSEAEALSSSNPSSLDIAQNGASVSTLVVPGAKAFIQIFSDDQLGDAERLRQTARSLGIAAPGVENVVTTAAKRNRKPPASYKVPTLLVFKQVDKDVALRLREAVLANTGIELAIEDRSTQAAFRSVPVGQLEIWLPDPSVVRNASAAPG
jgi:hypothetical protein